MVCFDAEKSMKLYQYDTWHWCYLDYFAHISARMCSTDSNFIFNVGTFLHILLLLF